MREKRVGGKGPKAHSENSDFGTPMIEVLFSGLSIRCANTQPSLCNKLGPFQAIWLGPFRVIQAIFRQF